MQWLKKLSFIKLSLDSAQGSHNAFGYPIAHHHIIIVMKIPPDSDDNVSREHTRVCDIEFCVIKFR